MSPVALATLPAELLLGHSLQPPFLVLALFNVIKINHFRKNRNIETMDSILLFANLLICLVNCIPMSSQMIKRFYVQLLKTMF
jgi:hypothetical protein